VRTNPTHPPPLHLSQCHERHNSTVKGSRVLRVVPSPVKPSSGDKPLLPLSAVKCPPCGRRKRLVSGNPLYRQDSSLFKSKQYFSLLLPKRKLLSAHIDIEIEIDKLTNSIENRISGEVFDTEVVKIDPAQGWLLKKKDPTIIQGLISIEDNKDHVYMHLIENASFNKGKNKLYVGVPANLVAFACKCSFEYGHEGYVGFVAKSRLIEHYRETLKAEVLYGNYMRIKTTSALYLIDRYFNK
jgi:hypothetical protein